MKPETTFINQHRLWHYEAFGDTTGLDQQTLSDSVGGYLQVKNWYSALTCLNILEEVAVNMSSTEKAKWHFQRANCFIGLYQEQNHGSQKEIYAREAQKQLNCVLQIESGFQVEEKYSINFTS
ncbi:MAG: hypothetical protein K0U37_04510 [Gammaproteobacteria bacterium]|nr:hypothetical protein [Gammaproteobacteria bacterium]